MEGDVARLAGMQMRLRLSRLISATLIVSAATLAWVHLTGADGRYFPLFTGAWTTMSTILGPSPAPNNAGETPALAALPLSPAPELSS